MIERKPDYEGTARAWEIEGDPAIPDQAATIKAWVVNGPYHPFWNWWMVGCIHLREIPGVRPPNKKYPEAEHEIMFVSINPEHDQPDPDKPFPQNIEYLVPLDLMFQFDGLTDEQAAEVAEQAVKMICNGMSCDSDFRSWWERFLTDAVNYCKRGPH